MPISNKRALVLDTQVLFPDPYMRKGWFSQLRAHLERDPATTLLISEVVIREVVNHQRKDLSSALERLRSAASALADLHPNLDERFSHISIEATVLEYERRLREILSHSFRAEILELPHVSHSVVLDRAIRRQMPFDEKGRGYQDTLLWLSLVALSNGGEFATIVFVSNNIADFGDKASQGLNAALQAELSTGTIEYVKTLPEAFQRLFSPLPQNLPIQTDANLHRQVVQCSRDSILADLQLAIDEEMHEEHKYTIDALGDMFDIVKAKAEQLQDSKVALTLEVRFWRCTVTKWLWQRDPDVFSDHLADILFRTVIVLTPPGREPDSLQVTAYEVLELDEGRNLRSIPWDE